MKTLTVMVSLYEAGDFIENRLNNLYESSFKNEMEIWVVNANSPDDRDDLIPRKFNAKYIKLPDRIPVYAAWNYIISNSSSQYLTSANADDIVSPLCYEKLAKDLKNYDFAYPSWYTTETQNLRWDHAYPRVNVDPSGTPGNYCGDLATSGVGHFPMWRRSLHDQVGLFDEEYKALGDAEWWARCYYKLNAKFYWRKEFLACYLYRNGQNLWHQSISQGEWDRYHAQVNRYKGSR